MMKYKWQLKSFFVGLVLFIVFIGSGTVKKTYTNEDEKHSLLELSDECLKNRTISSVFQTCGGAFTIIYKEKKISLVDSAELIHSIKIRKIDIAEIVFGDCIYFYLKNDCKEEALSYPKNIVEKNRDFIFSTVFFEKIQKNEFSLFPAHIDGQKCLCVNISENTESSEFSVIYWFQKTKDRFYFVGMTCIG